MGISHWLDLVMLFVVLMYAVIVVSIFLTVCYEPIATYRVDKSTIVTEESIEVDPPEKTGKDVLMALVVADDLASFPRAVRINDTPVIRLTSEWVINRNANVANIYAPTGAYKLGAMLDWKVTDVRYVYDGDGGYIQYTLTP